MHGGGLPGWDRNPELPAALCKRKNGFKQSGKRLPRSPKISRRRAPKLGREDGGTPPLWDFATVPKESRYQRSMGAAKDRMEKGRAGDPGITDRKALKASGRYRLQKLPSTVKNEFVVPSIRDGKG